MLSSTDKYEIINIIPSLDSNKPTGPNSIPKGRNPRYETNPDLFHCVTSFLKQNSFDTERRRKASTATGTGVTLEKIRTPIYEMIPELEEREISRNTIHNLFVAPITLFGMNLR